MLFIDVLCFICLNSWLLNVANVMNFEKNVALLKIQFRLYMSFFQGKLIKYPSDTSLLIFVIESSVGLQLVQWNESQSLCL